MLLGTLVGLGSNIVKNSFNSAGKSIGFADMSSQQRAIGMFLPKHKMRTKQGKVVGYLADQTAASLIGCVTVFAFSITGKKKPVLRGSAMGLSAWLLLYGVLGTIGATKIYSKKPSTMLTEFIAHLAFGATSGLLIDKLGEDGLFTGEIPMKVTPNTVTLEKRKLAIYNDPSGLDTELKK